MTFYALALKNNTVEQKAHNKKYTQNVLLCILISTDVLQCVCMNICRIYYVENGEPVKVLSNSELLKIKYTIQRFYNFNEVKFFLGNVIKLTASQVISNNETFLSFFFFFKSIVRFCY